MSDFSFSLTARSAVLCALCLLAPWSSFGADCRAVLHESLANSASVRTLESKGYEISVLSAAQSPFLGEPPFGENDVIAWPAAGRASPGTNSRTELFAISETGRPMRAGVVATFSAGALPGCGDADDLRGMAYVRSDLAVRARARLNRHYSTQSLHPGLGELVLELEATKLHGYAARGPEAERAKAAYTGLVRAVASRWRRDPNATFESRMTALVAYLYPYYRRYAGFQPYLTPLLLGPRRANCVGQSLLVAALIVDAGLEFPADWRPGLQLYDDHIEPVAFHRPSSRVVSLVTGRETPLDASIYSPELISFAIANAEGLAVHSEREFNLKIASVPLHAATPTYAASYGAGRRREPKRPWSDILYFSPDYTMSRRSPSPPPAAALMDPPTPFGTEQVAGSRRGLSRESGPPAPTSMTRQQFQAQLRAWAAEPEEPELPASGQADPNPGALEITDVIVDRLWSRVPRNLWPTRSPRRRFATSALKTVPTDRSASGSGLIGRLLPVVRAGAASAHEHANFVRDFDVALIAEPNFTIDAQGLDEPAFQIVFRSESDLLSATSGQGFDPAAFGSWFTREANAYASARLTGLSGDAVDVITALESAASRVLAPAPRAEDSLRTIRETLLVERWFDGLIEANIMSKPSEAALTEFLRLQNSLAERALCPLAAAMKRLRTAVEADPYGWVKWTETLAPDSATRLYQLIGEATALSERTIRSGHPTALPCGDSNEALNLLSEGKRPLHALLSELVRRSNHRERPRIQRTPIEIPVVFGIASEGAPATQRLQPITTPRVQTEPPIQRPAAAAPFELRADILANALLAQAEASLRNPVVQLHAFTWWTQDAQRHYETKWARSSPRIESSYLALWAWPALLAESVWTPRHFERTLQELRVATGGYLTGRLPIELGGTNWLGSQKMRPWVARWLATAYRLHMQTTPQATRARVVDVNERSFDENLVDLGTLVASMTRKLLNAEITETGPTPTAARARLGWRAKSSFQLDSELDLNVRPTQVAPAGQSGFTFDVHEPSQAGGPADTLTRFAEDPWPETGSIVINRLRRRGM